MLAAITDACETRDNNARIVRVAKRDIMSRVSKVFPVNSGNYARFQTKRMNDFKDLDLVICAENIAIYAEKYFDELSAKGLTEDIITDLGDKKEDFRKSITAMHQAESEREGSTINRIVLTNSLYVDITEIFDYGKTYWASRNHAKDSDYVIYNTPSGNPELSGEVVIVRGNVLDSLTSQPVIEGEVIFEYHVEPVTVGPDGKWQCDNVPIECTQIWGTAPVHITNYKVITLRNDGDNTFEILMTPRLDNPPPPNT